MRPLLQRSPGLRLPSGWDGFEIAVRAILGQQVSVAAARTLATRLAHIGAACRPLARHRAWSICFRPRRSSPRPISPIGVTRARAETIRTVARALLDGRVDFQPERTLDAFVARWVALPGIGPWTAHYIAMRALGHPDAFPAEDLVLRKRDDDTPRDPGPRRAGRGLAPLARLCRDSPVARHSSLSPPSDATNGTPMTTSLPRMTVHLGSPVGAAAGGRR